MLGLKLNHVSKRGHRSSAAMFITMPDKWVLFLLVSQNTQFHHSDVIMSMMATQIAGISIVYWSVSSGADQRKHRSSVPLAFVREIHHWPGNSQHKRPVKWKIFTFDDIIMFSHVTWRISSTIAAMRHDRKCKYTFTFPEMNSTQRLTHITCKFSDVRSLTCQKTNIIFFRENDNLFLAEHALVNHLAPYIKYQQVGWKKINAIEINHVVMSLYTNWFTLHLLRQRRVLAQCWPNIGIVVRRLANVGPTSFVVWVVTLFVSESCIFQWCMQ